MMIGRSRGMDVGQPYPLGPTFDGKGVNFALFSAHAEKVELCVFDRHGNREVERHELPGHTDQVFHGYLEMAQPGMLYGYRVYGPYEPKAGHRFNHHKLLVDPYAKALQGELRWGDALFGYRVGSVTEDLTFDTRNSARLVPKCRVTPPAPRWEADAKPRTPMARSVIYETHLRGTTMSHPDVQKSWRGTAMGLASEPVLEHLQTLGVTAVELLPVHAFVRDRFLVDKGLTNYWGYNTLNFFAPEPAYLATGELDEFRMMVRRLHEAGIEVILDVVYNHTCEGNEMGPTLSFKGIDNASYYRLNPEDPRHYWDTTGCGNSLNVAHQRVLQMIADSLRYWTEEMGVDGFRFDLAPALGRTGPNFEFHDGAAFFDILRQDPALNRVKLIAEPWDVGDGGYRLGGFPPGWSEWNDKFRDTVRAYWRGDEGKLPELARVLAGSAQQFDHSGRSPQASVNFVTAHDGFTLHDLVSYDGPHNEANQEDSGHGHNLSRNYGAEGPTDVAEIQSVRARQARNILTTLFLSHGVPMMLGGDEFGRTQQGNNNAYCQDNEITWFDWARAAQSQELQSFVQRLIRLRQTHPILQSPAFLHSNSKDQHGIPDIDWLTAGGEQMGEEHWHDPAERLLAMRLNGAAIGVRGALLVYFNAGEEGAEVTMPSTGRKGRWRLILDTFEPEAEERELEHEHTHHVPRQCVHVFERTTRRIL